MAVTAIVNVYDEYDFARVAGPLVAERIEVRQLRDRAGDRADVPANGIDGRPITWPSAST